MRFLIISDAPVLKKENKLFSYAPYVNEMKLWIKHFEDVVLVSPTKYNKELLVESFDRNLKVSSIPSISLISFLEILKSVLVLPYILFKLFLNMYMSDHIHIRSPGSIGLLACFVQIFFPFTPKTAKYAGNWDPKSKQPLSYKIQKWILSNTFLTRKMKVLVYGNWPLQTKNIIPFFTASYSQNEIEAVSKKELKDLIRLIYVGGLTVGKQPLLSVQTIHELINKGYQVQLDIYGDGIMRNEVENYVKSNQLEKSIFLHGNQPKNVVKEAYKEAHFLLFISKSEGWPKVVAEAMFWKCLPISSKVSCVPYMLDDGSRGSLVEANVSKEALVKIIIEYIKNENIYQKEVLAAQNWAQSYTLDTFEAEIQNILLDA
ncbi:glycosyltransferase [Polaribacter sp. IC073]|uniref:glycosyltransferase n=1 Tax=Polaribacter sp. IC073 TaxID=2508540 RepID=UPI0011BEAA07|nr:glycosyltransferase [Polaribacter sp. IC073]TXD49134.1 glycosyltransferase [Polaribacter sp. IC073]